MNINEFKEVLNNKEILSKLNFTPSSDDGDSIRGCCPIHGGDNENAFIFKESTKLWYCHTGCKRGGDIIDLVMGINKVDFTSAINYICKLQGIDPLNLKVKTVEKDKYNNFSKWITSITKVKYEISEFLINENELSGIKSYKHYGESICKKFNIMFSEKITLDIDKYVTNKLVFPITQNGINVGYVLRATSKHDVTKWMNVPKGLKTSEILYNYDRAKDNDGNVILVEGIGDAISVDNAGYNNVVAVFGSVLSKGQIEALMGICTEITFMFDGDEAGEKGVNSSYKLVKHLFDCYKCTIKNNKDPGDLNNEEIKNIIESRVKI